MNDPDVLRARLADAKARWADAYRAVGVAGPRTSVAARRAEREERYRLAEVRRLQSMLAETDR